MLLTSQLGVFFFVETQLESHKGVLSTNKWYKSLWWCVTKVARCLRSFLQLDGGQGKPLGPTKMILEKRPQKSTVNGAKSW